MATSQQQWRHGRQQLLVVAVALALVLFVGGADAWQCRQGYMSCDKQNPDGCETCVANDAHNCGWCGNVCQSGKCQNGKCVEPQCPQGQVHCNNGCKDLNQDPWNCGWCGNVCKSGKCQYGKCVQPQCPQGQVHCNNGCKDLQNDIYNCGQCGNQCPCTLKWGEPTCNWGKCGQQCKQGWNYDNQQKCCVQGH